MKTHNSRLPRECRATLHAENFDQSEIHTPAHLLIKSAKNLQVIELVVYVLLPFPGNLHNR